MAQKVVGLIKLQIPAGKATPAPPVGPALGQHGVNIVAFTKDFNERTKNDIGLIIPVVITVYADRSFTFITKTPPAAVLPTLFPACSAAGLLFGLRRRLAVGSAAPSFCVCLAAIFPCVRFSASPLFRFNCGAVFFFDFSDFTVSFLSVPAVHPPVG